LYFPPECLTEPLLISLKTASLNYNSSLNDDVRICTLCLHCMFNLGHNLIIIPPKRFIWLWNYYWTPQLSRVSTAQWIRD